MSSSLQISLETSVPLWIEVYKSYSWHERQVVLLECEEVFAEYREALFYPMEDKTSKVFNAVAKTIAILAFCGNGITIFDNHWEAKDDTRD